MAAIAVCQKFDILALCDGDMSKVIDMFKDIAENELTKEDLIIQYQKIELYKKLVKKGDQGLSPLRALRVRDYKVMSTVTFMGERTGRSFESGQINYGSTITKQ